MYTTMPGWSVVKFIPNFHVFKTNPEIMDQARKAIGIEVTTDGDTYDASLTARYKYEINQRRNSVKTAVRKNIMVRSEMSGKYVI